MRILRFNEVNLNLAELEKTSKEGGLRGDVLVRKLKKQIEEPQNIDSHLKFVPKSGKVRISGVDNPEEIIQGVTDGSEKVYDIEKAKDFFTKNKKYLPVFDVEDDEYKLNDIEKTKEFGSSRGSSLGSEETRIVESIQCLYCALRQNLKRPISDDDFELFFDELGYIREELLEYTKFEIDLDSEIIENYRAGWGVTFITTANSLFEYREIYTLKSERKSILDDRKTYQFFQISFTGGVMLSIKNKFSSLVSKMQLAKWNPSDMWAVNIFKTKQLLKSIDSCQTIEELNKLVDDSFKSRDLVGVSLKKIRNLKSTNLLVNKITERPTYSFLKVRTSFKSNSSLGVNVLLSQKSDLKSENRDITLAIRTFAGTEKFGNVQGEVIGTTSRHGKISLTEINSIFSKVSQEFDIQIPLVPDYKYFRDMPEDELGKKVESLNNLIGALGDKSKEMKSEKSSTKVRLVSKLQALLIAKNLYDFRGISDRICQLMMYYALAIENSQFICPMYVRIL
jgi:hypothetical protein